jgi:hypothetical protein
MFDVRPVDESGILDLEKINSIRHSNAKENKKSKAPFKNILPLTLDIKPVDRDGNLDLDRLGARGRGKEGCQPVYEPDSFRETEKPSEPVYDIKIAERKRYEIPVSPEDGENVKKVSVEFVKRNDEEYFGEARYASEYNLYQADYFEKFKSPQEKEKELLKKSRKGEGEDFSFRDIFFYEKFFRPLSSGRLAFSFAGAAMVIFLIIFGYNLASKGLMIKKLALENGTKVYADLISAKDGLEKKNFESAAMNFNRAYENLDQISGDIDSLGGIIVESSKYIPYLSKLSSGSHLAKAAKDLSKVGALLSENTGILRRLKNPTGAENGNVSYLKIFKDGQESFNQISQLLKDAEDNLDSVNSNDIPEDKRGQFIELKKKLPEAGKFLSGFTANEKIFTDILGGNGPRKYLFLFQNNQEIRATGGFIGTYAVLDIFNGRVRNFFVDGIFNPDGQLEDRIVPPLPIQKISANWSMHDSNWWPDFPASAEKATLFYEKTGGPTVDGVIAITPVFLQKLLEITGPIDMPEYGVTIDEDNFLENIQSEVESNYDKELNQPKKILSDLAPKILDKVFNPENFADIAGTLNALTESLNEKHILIYSKNWETEKVLSAQGWSGEILDTAKDYLSVINTNINGYKTDGIIDEKITHLAEIQPDGSVVDTLTITRHHNGGNTSHDWWNKVNADYMRVYVPKGSKLISASGQTREIDSSPLDYNALGYKRDPQVKMEEDSMAVDDETGTRVYKDSGKTVFANWTYVSPQETVEIKYTYLLPFKIDTNLTTKPADTYSLLAQKQSGSIGSDFISEVKYPDFYKVLWKYPDGYDQKNNSLSAETNLKTDRFFGVALSKK